MKMGLKIVSRRDVKNIDSTDNVKGVKKPSSQKKLGRRRHFFPNLPYEWRQKIFIFYLRGVKNVHLALRGGSEFLSRYFEFDNPPPTTGLKNKTKQTKSLNKRILSR